MYRNMKDFKKLKEKIQRGDASEEDMDKFRQYIQEVAIEEMGRSALDPQVRDRSGAWRGVWERILEKQRKEGMAYYLYRLGWVAAAFVIAAVVSARRSFVRRSGG